MLEYNNSNLDVFDHYYYISEYKDLKDFTKEESLSHYIHYGRNENRYINYMNMYHSKIKIPKIIHFIWVGNNKITDDFIKYILTWKKHHNDWKIRFWTNDDLTENNFINLEYIKKAKKMAQKADIMRYEIIYNYGGLYIDIDFMCYKNIEKLIENLEFFVCNGDFDCENKYVISNGLIGSIINSDITKTLIDNIKNITINETSINKETGPYYFGSILNYIYPNKFKKLDSRLFFPNTYQEYIKDVDVDEYRNRAYAEHKWGNTWSDKNKDNNDYIKPKYIIYTSEYLNDSYGGVSIVAYNMYISLKKYYETYIILNPYDKPNYFRLINEKEDKIYSNLDSIIRNINIRENDIVIFHNCERYYLYNRFKDYTIKCYLVVHGFYDMETLDETLNNIKINRESIIRKIYAKNEYNISLFDNIIVVNPVFAKILNNKYPDKNIYYIPNCISKNDNVYISKDIFNDIDPIIRFIYIGRVEEYKNINILIEAIKDIPNITLTLIGTNTDNLNVNYPNIIYIDQKTNSECIEYLKLHDVLINISLTESFPISILEAGLYKKCCYISDLKGLKDIFENNCIYARNHYDVIDIKNDILNIVRNKIIIKELGEKLYNHIMKNYYIEMYHQYLYQLQII